MAFTKGNIVKGFVRRFAKRYGYEILGPSRSFAAHRSLIGLLRQEQINLVLDVGANAGQFANELRASGYNGQIVSFEPLSAAHAELRKRAEGDAKWTIADRTAIGVETGSVEIHVSANSVSSSILKMLPSHWEAEPQSGYIGTETVPVNTLDSLCSLTPADRVFLKIDVQGYEKQVLDGAQHILRTCRGVISEMSLVPLYEGQLLARQIWDLLAEQGFEVWSLEPGFRHSGNGRMMQLDAVFVRRN